MSNTPPLAVDLFSGTGSLCKRATAAGYAVRSYDLLATPLAGPLHIHDAGDIRSALMPSTPIDFLWASPPCEGFSVAAIGKSWHKDHTPKSDTARLGMELLEAAIAIIARERPVFWCIENPRGKMRRVIDPVFAKHGITDYRRVTVTYCQYGETRMKPTDIWTNLGSWTPRPHCKNGDPCHVAAPRGARTGTQGMKSYLDKSRVPAELLDEILAAVEMGKLFL